MMTNEELQKMSEGELQKELTDATAKLVKHKMAIQTRESLATSQLNHLRKYVARIKTFKRQLQS